MEGRHYEQRGENCRESPENVGIVCENTSRCNLCGWNPKVREERIKKIREERRRERKMVIG